MAVAKITLFGNYLAAGFSLNSGGVTGTTITYVTPAAAHLDLAVNPG